jgi:hypothetical protein
MKLEALGLFSQVKRRQGKEKEERCHTA